MTLEEQLKSILNQLGYSNEYRPSPLERYLTFEQGGGEDKEVYVHGAEGDLYLLPLGDMHLGSKYFNRELFEQYLNFIAETENCFTVLLGDQIENATKTSVGLGLFEEDLHLEDQIELVYQLLLPIADKIWGIHEGNHEFRTAALAGFRPLKIVAQRLGVPYLGYQGYHLVKAGEQVYHVFTAHNRGSGRTVPGKVRAAEDADKIAVCDVYITGHSHIIHHHAKPIFYIDEVSRTVKERLRHYVVCGSFLNYWGSYAEKELLSPAAKGAPLIKFCSNKHEVVVSTRGE